MKVTVSFTLDDVEDRDILRWLEAQENRSAALRAIIRAHIQRGVTLADLYQAVRDLERLIRTGAPAAPPEPPDRPEPPDSPEPPDLAAALDALANL